MEEQKKVAPHDLNQILRSKQELDQLHSAIGVLNSQVFGMTSQAVARRQELEALVKESILRAGVKEEEVQFYAIDQNTGEVKDKRELQNAPLPSVAPAPEPVPVPTPEESEGSSETPSDS